MEKLKPVIFIVVIALISIPFVGCKQETAPAPQEEQEVAPAPQEEQEVAPAPQEEQEVVTLRFPTWWMGEPGNDLCFIAQAEEFEKQNPNIKIEMYDVPYPIYTEKMLTEIQGGNAPDILHLLDQNIGAFALMGALEPLTERIKGSEIEKNFMDLQFKPPVVINNETWGIVQEVEALIPIYNKNILKEKGVSEFPDSPEGFFEMINQITKAPEFFGYAMMVKPGNEIELYLDFMVWVIGYGGHLTNTNGEPTANSKEVKEALTMFKKIYDSGSIPKDMDKSTYRQMWWEGKVGILIDGPWMYTFAKQENPGFEKDLVTALPPFPGHGTAMDYQIFSISAQSKHKEEAWKFIEFLSSKEEMQRMVEMTKCVPPYKGVPSDDFINQYEWFKNYSEAANNYVVGVVPVGLEAYTNEVMKLVGDRVGEVLYNNRSIDETLDDLQSDLETFIKSHK